MAVPIVSLGPVTLQLSPMASTELSVASIRVAGALTGVVTVQSWDVPLSALKAEIARLLGACPGSRPLGTSAFAECCTCTCTASSLQMSKHKLRSMQALKKLLHPSSLLPVGARCRCAGSHLQSSCSASLSKSASQFAVCGHRTLSDALPASCSRVHMAMHANTTSWQGPR